MAHNGLAEASLISEVFSTEHVLHINDDLNNDEHLFWLIPNSCHPPHSPFTIFQKWRDGLFFCEGFEFELTRENLELLRKSITYIPGNVRDLLLSWTSLQGGECGLWESPLVKGCQAKATRSQSLDYLVEVFEKGRLHKSFVCLEHSSALLQGDLALGSLLINRREMSDLQGLILYRLGEGFSVVAKGVVPRMCGYVGTNL